MESLTIHDFRKIKTPLPLPNKEFPDAIIWYEGVQKHNFHSFTRLTIGPTKSLIIAFLPPSLKEIQKVIQTSHPQQVVLYPPQYKPLTLNELMNAFGRMLKYAINNKQGLIQTDKMAAAMGQRNKTIKTILEYLDAAGKITLVQHPDTDILVKSGGIKKPDLEIYFLEQLNILYKETRAFQNWYLTMDCKKLNEEIVPI